MAGGCRTHPPTMSTGRKLRLLGNCQFCSYGRTMQYSLDHFGPLFHCIPDLLADLLANEKDHNVLFLRVSSLRSSCFSSLQSSSFIGFHRYVDDFRNQHFIEKSSRMMMFTVLLCLHVCWPSPAPSQAPHCHVRLHCTKSSASPCEASKWKYRRAWFVIGEADGLPSGND